MSNHGDLHKQVKKALYYQVGTYLAERGAEPVYTESRGDSVIALFRDGVDVLQFIRDPPTPGGDPLDNGQFSVKHLPPLRGLLLSETQDATYQYDAEDHYPRLTVQHQELGEEPWIIDLRDGDERSKVRTLLLGWLSESGE